MLLCLGPGCGEPAAGDTVAPETQLTASSESPFGIFSPFTADDGGSTPTSDETLAAYIDDLGVPWVQEMYFTPGLSSVPDTLHVYTRVGPEGGYRIPQECGVASADVRQGYRDAIRELVRDRKDRIQYYEVATEPSGFPPPVGWKDCADGYTAHLQDTYDAVKAECPECKVVFGGLSGVYIDMTPSSDPAVFLDEALAAGAGEYFDVFEFKQHAHRAGDYPELRNRYDIYASIFSQHGLDLNAIEVFVETAMYDGDPCVSFDNSGTCLDPFDLPEQSESDQAAGLVKTYIYGLASGIDRVFWNLVIERYNFGGSATNVFNMYGLVHNRANDGVESKKLSYFSLKKLAQLLEGSDWSRFETIRESEGVFIYEVFRAGEPIWVAWSETGHLSSIQLTGVRGTSVVVTDAVPSVDTGADVGEFADAFPTRIVDAAGDQVSLTIGATPVYIQQRD